MLRRPLESAQYTSLDFTDHLRELGLVPSYGSTGDRYDNAAMETFWATLKRELSWAHGPLVYMSRSRLRSALFDNINSMPQPDYRYERCVSTFQKRDEAFDQLTDRFGHLTDVLRPRVESIRAPNLKGKITLVMHL